jgi:alkylation response protein AidB-like acyl-CoA dehydrogenase
MRRAQKKEIEGRRMDFAFTHEQGLWRDTVHAFMEKEVAREYTRGHDASREFPEEVFRKMAKLGWLGLLVDEENGGSVADPIMFAIFCEAIGKYSLDTAACIMTSMFTATNISRHGTPERKCKYLQPFLARKGKLIRHADRLAFKHAA